VADQNPYEKELRVFIRRSAERPMGAYSIQSTLSALVLSIATQDHCASGA
jgi:hypothetical protein